LNFLEKIVEALSGKSLRYVDDGCMNLTARFKTARLSVKWAILALVCEDGVGETVDRSFNEVQLDFNWNYFTWTSNIDGEHRTHPGTVFVCQDDDKSHDMPWGLFLFNLAQQNRQGVKVE